MTSLNTGCAQKGRWALFRSGR